MDDPTTVCPFCRKEHDVPELLELEQQLKAREWVSVEDALPEKMDVYNVYFASAGNQWFASYIADGWIDESRDQPVTGVTHWMPLPAPPEEGE